MEKNSNALGVCRKAEIFSPGGLARKFYASIIAERKRSCNAIFSLGPKLSGFFCRSDRPDGKFVKISRECYFFYLTADRNNTNIVPWPIPGQNCVPGCPALKMEGQLMLIKGTEGFLPLQNSTTRLTALSGGKRAGRRDSRYDNLSLSVPAAELEKRDFQNAVAMLSQQVRTNTSTGKIQELHRLVSSGEYRVDPRGVAARMLLLEEGE